MWRSESARVPYLNLIKRATTDEKVFNMFKSIPIFRAVVGTSSPEHVAHCYKTLVENLAVRQNLGNFRKNDSLGTPNLLTIQNVKTAQDTIRFAETAARLSNEFKSLDGLKITEFGSNYGGLAFVLLTQWPGIAKYHLVDLPEVQEFSKVYLDKLGFQHKALTWEQSTECDLFVSEYSMTEYEDSELYDFYERFAKPAKLLWLRCNIVEPDRYKAFLNHVNRDFHLEVIQEPVVNFNRIIIGHQ